VKGKAWHAAGIFEILLFSIFLWIWVGRFAGSNGPCGRAGLPDLTKWASGS